VTQGNPNAYVRVRLLLMSSASHRRLAIAPETALSSGSDHDAPGELLQVGELAKATGKTVRAIHLYEDMGLLKPEVRSKSRYRLFASDAVVRVRWISKLQSLGFSLSEIQEIVRDHDGAPSAASAAAKLRALYIEKLVHTRSKITELEALEGELEASLRYLDACDSACAPKLQVDSCPTCERHPEDRRHAPELVAGVHAQ
jgi:MerR family transcriptional regulator, copper efflux regulator